jgi:hypothetical protein
MLHATPVDHEESFHAHFLATLSFLSFLTSGIWAHPGERGISGSLLFGASAAFQRSLHLYFSSVRTIPLFVTFPFSLVPAAGAWHGVRGSGGGEYGYGDHYGNALSGMSEMYDIAGDSFW